MQVPGPLHDAFRLSKDQCQRFARDGFLSGIQILDDEGLARVRAAVDEVRARLEELEPQLYEVEQSFAERPEEVVCHFLGGFRVHPELRRLIDLPQVTVPLLQLLGCEGLRFWHDQVFYKPPHHPGAVPWHQDYSYWQRTTPARHITLNLMLDDADADNGCLQFVPGSQRWGLLPRLPFDAPQDAVFEHLDATQRAAFRPQLAPLRAGQASIHHSHTLHGSGPNRSSRPRRAVVLNYMAADTRSAADEPLLRGVPTIPRGEIVRGAAFPLVLGSEPQRADQK